MKISTLPRYLVGSRGAILEVAGSRWSVVVGILFVLSAGFAREYDGEDLLHEPWHALRPLGASLVSGTVLFLLVHAAALLRADRGTGDPPRFGHAYRAFMGLFWMTAPMAWLYAVPYERFMSPVDAVQTNLWTLAFVAAWRVVLITRVISVVYGIHIIASFFLVMLFSDALVFTVVLVVPTPVIDFMGGLRQTERDALVASVTFTLGFYSFVSAPIWIIGALIGTWRLRPKWTGFCRFDKQAAPCGLLVTAALALVAFVPLLVVGQPEQINRREAERLLRAGRVGEAIAQMSERGREAYPPHWDPPPRLGYDEREPDLAAVRQAIVDQQPAAWVRAVFAAKVGQQLQRVMRVPVQGSWRSVVDMAESWGETAVEVDPEVRARASFLLDHDPGLSEEDRVALARIRDLWGPAMSQDDPLD